MRRPRERLDVDWERDRDVDFMHSLYCCGIFEYLCLFFIDYRCGVSWFCEVQVQVSSNFYYIIVKGQ